MNPIPIRNLAGASSEPAYVDGLEERLLALFRQTDAAVAREVESILEGSPSFAELVHLSPQRWHLLDWYPFDPAARLLEVGAGCGALTGLLCERVAHVDAIEPSPVRAEVIACRHRARRNLDVLVGKADALAEEGKSYDVVVVVGVLEYAGAKAGANTASSAPGMLGELRRLVGTGGEMLLAIENQVGLKYLAGHPEDHHGTPLAGIEDYVAGGARTFGRGELEAHLRAARFEPRRWYQPFPDYKLPTSVYSDDIPPGSLEPLGVVYPTPALTAPSEAYFSESAFARILDRNSLLGHFANSYLVACRAA